MDGVVLLHGIARSRKSMAKMERALQANNYLTLNLEYPSRRRRLIELAEGLDDAISPFSSQLNGRLHFVTHSMGALVARAFIALRRPVNLGRLVAMAPPNAGSEVADFLRTSALYAKFYGPAGAELTTTNADALHMELGRVDYPLGIIAGDRTVDPIASLFILPRPNDGRVSVLGTQIDGMADHIVIHSSHALIMGHSEAILQTLYFLRNGCFKKVGGSGIPMPLKEEEN
jgi:hypothetical protein